jgi:hypothetical protein
MTATTANPHTAAATSLGVGPRVELARYTVTAGERVIYGQRVDGIVRFQRGERGVLVLSSRAGEDDTCRPRDTPFEAAGTKPDDMHV